MLLHLVFESLLDLVVLFVHLLHLIQVLQLLLLQHSCQLLPLTRLIFFQLLDLAGVVAHQLVNEVSVLFLLGFVARSDRLDLVQLLVLQVEDGLPGLSLVLFLLLSQLLRFQIELFLQRLLPLGMLHLQVRDFFIPLVDFDGMGLSLDLELLEVGLLQLLHS